MELTENDRYILVSSGSTDRASFDLDFRNRQELGEGFVCKVCRTIKPEPGPIGTVIVQGVIDDAPFGTVEAGLGLARREFLYSLGDETVARYFHVGKVITYKGKHLNNWVAYRARQLSVVRAGIDHAGFRLCETCGNIFYFGRGDAYLYPAPPKGIEVFGEGGVSTAFVTTYDLAVKIKETVEKMKWKRVVFTELPILDAPRDGLGEIPALRQASMKTS